MKNETFNIGEKYMGDFNKRIYEVVDIKPVRKKVYVCFKEEKIDKVYEVELRTAQELLITKI